MDLIGPRSRAYAERARRRVAGLSSSPARDVSAVGLSHPVVGAAGRGAYITDVDGRRYIDYLQAFGPGILGHGHPGVTAAAAAALADGPVWGIPAPSEARLAEALAEAVPSMARIRFTASGTEAVMSAVRLARAATGRTLVVKFDAGYHGHADVVLGQTGSAAAHAGADGDEAPAGVPADVLRHTATLTWNDAEGLERYLACRGREVAALLVEPVAGNIGIVPPDPAFVRALNRARETGALVIADEVVSAFRFRYGAAQDLVGLRADLTCVGKIVGGGLPIGAYGGSEELMRLVRPEGPVFQAGTYAGHPVACAAGLAALTALARPGVYETLEERGFTLAEGLRRAAREAGWPVTLSRVGGAFTLWPGRDETLLGPVRTAEDVEATDADAFAALYRSLLAHGVLLPPSRFEAWLVTLAHDAGVVAETLERAAAAFASMGAAGARPATADR
ncbi:MAG: glutamate-1-semialdehyde 2,1-aminomutase [Firmicutes bacterium]|nr:glutamate-1-semialdehyde 2,1-aminomutase [Bacillota bacterium]